MRYNYNCQGLVFSLHFSFWQTSSGNGKIVIIIFKPTLPRKEKDKTKGNVDAELVLHTMIEFPNYSKAIIISGDGDFHCLIEYLKKKKKLARVLIPNRRKYSKLLWDFRADLDYLGGLRNKLERRKKN